MARYKIDLQQSDDKDLLVEISDQALEAACGGLMQDRNSCFWILLLHLSPSFASTIALDERIKRSVEGV